MSEQKQTLRHSMAARRDALGEEARVKGSAAVTARVQELPEFQQAKVVAAFAAFRSEVDAVAVVKESWRAGKVVVFPRVTRDSQPRLRFHRALAIADLAAGAYGVPEPLPHLPEVSLHDIDLFLVPGLAFDAQGRRLGYGGGYYDEVGAKVRAGAQANTQFQGRREGRAEGRAFLAGLGFDFQFVADCPAWAGDVALDCVVTDARVVRCTPC